MASPAVHRTSIQRVSTFKDRTTTTATPSSSTGTFSSLSLLDSFASDPIFSKFLSSDFNSTQFSSDALSSGTAAARAEKIQDGIRLLEKQLRSEVLNRHDDLLAQLSSVTDADSSLASIRSAVSTLQSSVRRIRSEIADPNRQIRSKTVQLSNLHFTVDLLQSTVRVLRLSKKLREVMAEPDVQKLDLSKAAQLHSEILRLCNENDLSGIGVIDEELKLVFEAGQRLRSEGMKALERGLEGFNQAEVGAGLQVFYNLGELRSTVDGLINKYKSQGVKSVSVALDMKAISGGGGGFGGPGGIQRSGTPQIGSGGKAKEALWQRMGSCMDQLHSVVVAIWHLQRVLSKKRDPFTHVLLLDEVMQDGDPLLTARVWEAIVKSFANQMKSTFTASSFVKEIFTIGYPKLLSMIENLVERISRDTDVKGVLPAITVEGRDQMVGAIEVFQTAFLALCLSRLSDLVNSVFPMSNRGSVPSKEHVSRIISRIQEEIEAVQLDARLTLLVLREISKVLLLLAQRAEYQISTGPEARQISGPATPAQVKNFTLCQHLQDIHGSISAMTKGLPPIASDILSQSLNTIYEVACDSVTSLFQSMLDHLESCILEIHNQNFGATDNNSSSYMEELQKHISHFRTEFLSKLLPSSAKVISIGTETICTRLVRSMASRVLIFFIRHASLVRPLSESGKLRMARDMAELELAVGQNLFPVEQLGAPYRALRAFRPVIFLETSQLNGSPLLQDLPPSVILHHLYSRAPDELQSPMQRNKLSPLQYSLWLDSQGEDQIWKGIKATLDDYAVQVKARGDKEFSPVYPLMFSLGSSITENNVVSRKSNTIN
ncbi:putative oligomeric Golgi complex subunit 5 protein [Helianthus annuus]|uniref:Conserved oligomeric Golgi complex subunit 5 n=1 Tax=Helianthus annuus TaxID=4232 RepID=A0A251U233_HELAN|nr:conserved oligomeric Golgi complex subunit 5 [Helianthus annuus]KAF5793340.1 putative oligomeric Golgi complex subunit 5 protein [Helianthus annuus]KAJ0528181.1 putative oligomeric Golgi complex subunit 5 protein [Helianthus annuus]KAJ0537060.1 putative oligomeric Golgi complex subunit 5 protein [Helianthus annuus]KAJ0544613.1 putative oligomeric Golgi complex subunit 5 protein [Helianthus annuus]KAJ0709620.1 putative oligomeric Golgi complex subunit 5 protein [Helianthus annuus]